MKRTPRKKLKRQGKKKRRKSPVAVDDYVKALNTLKPYILIDHYQEKENGDEEYFELVSNQWSPERSTEKRQLFNRLSEEAKEVVDLVLDTPDDLIELLYSPRSKKLSRKRIEKYLRKVWRRRKLVRIVMKELAEWVKSF